MGNTLIKSVNDNNINESLLGKEISEIFAKEEIDYKTDKGTIKMPINKIRACCLGVVKDNPRINDFITISLPDALDETNNYCKSKNRCIGETKLGLQFKGDPGEICNFKLPGTEGNAKPGTGSGCDKFMVNYKSIKIYKCYR